MLKRKWVFAILGGLIAVAGLAGLAFFALSEIDGEAVAEGAPSPDEPPPKTATEILAAEMAGEPDAYPKATAEDIQRPPAEKRDSISLAEEFDSLPASGEPEEPDEEKTEPKKRTPTSIPKKTESMFKVESAKTVISKNLDRKKALVQLRKDFAQDDCAADTGKVKTLKAVVELKKDGAVGKIKMQPSTAGDKELVKCLKKKLTAKAKAYKSKTKAGGQLTLQLKLK